MAYHEVKTSWKGKMAFEAELNGHKILMDTSEKGGGENSAAPPKPLMLTALTGCTGMDVISIMRKMRKEPESLELFVHGELSEGQPMVYTGAHLVYTFKAHPDYKNAAIQAIELSQEKYCGVSTMLKKAFTLTWEVIFNDEVILDTRKGETKNQNHLQ